MSAEIATVRCICNAGLHHCNGWMHLQPLVAPPSSVGARIARPFIPDVITTLREGARRGLGATAKPLYPIDGKAEGLDRRTSQTSLLEGGGPPQRWKEFEPVAFTPNIFFLPTHTGHMKHMKHKSRFSERRRILMGAGIATVRCICNQASHRRILYGRAKNLIQLRVQGRNPARFKGGYGVPRGFKGEKFEISP